MDIDNECEYIYDNGGEDAVAVVDALDELQEVDYVYTVIQECLDELVEEKRMVRQQEAVWQVAHTPLCLTPFHPIITK